MFHVGQLIVCVDASFEFTQQRHPNCIFVGDLDGLQQGTVYTVRAIGPHPKFGYTLVFLCEKHRPPCQVFHVEMGYNADRFRPIDDTKLSIFRAMLTDPPKVPARTLDPAVSSSLGTV